MKTLSAVSALREATAAWRRDGLCIALVPTMGNLHAGHLALVQHARALADRVVVSVFVNPSQFGPGEDYQRYPRTLDTDAAALEAHGCDLLYAPNLEQMYPRGIPTDTLIQVRSLSTDLCGAHRPGHFDAVATVVCKLLMQVQPDTAVFGQKDYQQWLLIQRMVSDLDIPVEIVGHATVRESDGLAMSSRNQYLTVDQRSKACCIYATLSQLRKDWSNVSEAGDLERQAHARLQAAGFVVDYVSIRDAETLGPAQPGTAAIALIAGRLGATRLIDNLYLDPVDAAETVDTGSVS